MKFTTTDNTFYRGGIGNIPKPWIEYSCKDYLDSVYKHFYDHIKHYDYDSGDDEIHDFVFEDGKAFRLVYDYWSEWYHEDDDENGLKYDIRIEEISIEEANVPEKKIERDWL